MTNTITVETVKLNAATGGRIRIVTAVTIPGYERVVFMERLSKRAAIEQARHLVQQGCVEPVGA
jgi:hypothetical protein